MQKHVKIYMDYFNLHGELVLCEVCNNPAVDVHHIEGRGKGKDVIENLIALCRDCHMIVNTDMLPKWKLKEVHKKNIHEN